MIAGDTLTILIAARNAAPTIERAIRSALIQGPCPILLVDDWSDDDTVARARDAAGARLRIVRPAEHRTLNHARQTGLDALETPFGMWLDADDELLPGRVERMAAAIEQEGADIVADGAEIADGATGVVRAVNRIPAFLRRSGAVREFERNYLPGDGVIAFRAERLRQLGYDPALHVDIDIILRAVAAGFRFALLDSIGYRIHTYSSSLSRGLALQRRMYGTALRKHDYSAVRRLYEQAGLHPAIAAWGVASMATFREEYAIAVDFVAEAERSVTEPDVILEPDGPLPVPERWRVAFHRGTLHLLIGQLAQGVHELQEAEALRPTAEGANNLGVALWRSGGGDDAARKLFAAALDRFPGFRDAAVNLAATLPGEVTTHALRPRSYRNDYPTTA